MQHLSSNRFIESESDNFYFILFIFLDKAGKTHLLFGFIFIIFKRKMNCCSQVSGHLHCVLSVITTIC